MNYFYQLAYTANKELSDFLKFKILDVSSWIVKNEFTILQLPIKPFLNTPLQNFIIKFQAFPLILKLDPMSFYNWHIDEKRKCAINMLIEGGESNCFFSNKLFDNSKLIKLTELKYKQNNFYLLNTQEKHAVLNLDKPRYMFSLGFNNYSYDEILKVCINERI